MTDLPQRSSKNVRGSNYRNWALLSVIRSSHYQCYRSKWGDTEELSGLEGWERLPPLIISTYSSPHIRLHRWVPDFMWCDLLLSLSIMDGEKENGVMFGFFFLIHGYYELIVQGNVLIQRKNTELYFFFQLSMSSICSLPETNSVGVTKSLWLARVTRDTVCFSALHFQIFTCYPRLSNLSMISLLL